MIYLQESRTKKSIRNIIWAIINKLAIIIMPFIVRTVLIYKLGAEYTGLSGLFTSVLTMLSLAELGFSNAMVYCMYEPIHNNDDATICALLNFYKKIYRYIGLIVLTFGIILVPFLHKLISGNVPTNVNIYILYGIYLSNTVLSYFLFAYKSSLLTAYQRNDKISIIGLICNTALYGAQIIILILTKNFYLYALILPISTLLMNFAYEKVSNTLFPNISCKGEVGKELKIKIKKRVIGIMLYKFSSTTRTSFDSVIISAFLGLVILTQYQNYFMLISSVLGVLSVVSNAVTASIGDSIVSKNAADNYLDFRKYLFVYMWVSSVCVTCIMGLIQPFMEMWVGKTLVLDLRMAILFCIYFYVQTMGDIVFVYRSAAGLWWEDRIRPVVESIANIVLNFLMVKVWGLYGVILATIITLVAINFIWGAHILFKYYFKRNMNEYLKIQIRHALYTILSCLLSLILCNMFGQGIFNFILKGIVCIVIPNILFIIIYRKNNLFKEAKLFITHLVMIIKKKS